MAEFGSTEPKLQRDRDPLFGPSGRNALFIPISIATIILGLLVRLPRLGTPPLDFHPARQYRTALIARALYEKYVTGLPSWKKEVAWVEEADPAVEPPLTEYLAATMYRLAGQERLWLPRLASVVFWISGAAWVFAVARRLFSKTAALIGLIYSLFIPYGIRASLP